MISDKNRGSVSAELPSKLIIFLIYKKMIEDDNCFISVAVKKYKIIWGSNEG